MATLHYNEEGLLLLGDVKARELVNRFETPLYVLDLEVLKKNISYYQDAFTSKDLKVKIYYASKAFLSMAFALLLKEEGLGLDVVSGGELYMALKAGFPGERILFNGNNKSEEELKLALDHKVQRIIVDNLEELDLIHALSSKRGEEVLILLRINPAVAAKTHAYLKTGSMDSKFGLGVADGTAMQAVERVEEMEYVTIKGLHCHIGSQITYLQPYREAIRVMNRFRREIFQKRGQMLPELDLGGGLGVEEGYGRSLIEEYASLILDEVETSSKKEGLPLPLLSIEPGRSIIDTAVTTLYQVGAIKEAGKRRYVIIDGGLSDNIRPALYQASYEALPERKGKREERVTIVGRCCESSDILIDEADLPPLKRGDILAIPNTGAYTCSMSSNYNGLPRPGIVLLKGKEVFEIRRRETWEDLLLRERIPRFLE